MDETVDVAALAAELRALVAKLRRRMREHSSSTDFTPSQIAVLVRLENGGPATVTDLARAEGVRPQSMGANVAVLEAAGFVEGVPDPADGRRTILSLTAEAREKVAAGRAAREGWLFQAVRATLTPAEQRELASAVELLKRVADS
ncbi:MarR family winged helix-turn-helix transcriptional regulator [Umezawaea tangerina]|uniref:MarR family winged helix-turn-helix transcriptional regulator n=1 Tax=Umezawaea tangerina TaxID=84725 RepID=UPI000AE7DC52|nr:MarR family transcriptional regulator [Umezawaea tangerina]